MYQYFPSPPQMSHVSAAPHIDKSFLVTVTRAVCCVLKLNMRLRKWCKWSIFMNMNFTEHSNPYLASRSCEKDLLD